MADKGSAFENGFLKLISQGTAMANIADNAALSSTASATGQTAVKGASAALIARAASATGHAVVVGTQGPVTVYSVPIVIQVAYPGYGTSVV